MKKKKRKIYISLPISGHDESVQRKKASEIAKIIEASGATPVVPFDVDCGKNPTYEDYICNDLRAMLDCDGIFFCRGWEQSCGCGIEHDVALRMKANGKKDFTMIYE